MRVLVDTDKKEIILPDEAKLPEVVKFLEKNFSGEDFMDYTVKLSEVVVLPHRTKSLFGSLRELWQPLPQIQPYSPQMPTITYTDDEGLGYTTTNTKLKDPLHFGLDVAENSDDG